MFQGPKGDSGPPASETEITNRALLVLFGLFLLLVFMDFQAKRHYRSMGLPEKFRLEKPITDRGLPSAEITKRTARDIFEKADEGLTKGVAALENELKLRPLVEEKKEVVLHFIRFRGGKSELVRVVRKLDEPAGPREVLELLREGPRGEKGLINAFDSVIHDLRIENGIAIVDLDERVGRMGPRVIRDRIDQITATLMQFPQIKGVKLLVNGRPVQTLGSEQLEIPSVLGLPDRLRSR